MELAHFDVHEEVFESFALRDNPLGDPCRRRLPVILPRDRPSGRRFPVVYVLAGYAGSGRGLTNWQAWAPSFPERLDRLRAEGAIGDLIAVLPDGFTRYGGSQYINSEATGRYGDMLARDLVAWTDERFPTLAAARHRAIAGKSSGGYGALVHGMLHPDVFSAVACHSGDMHFEYCYWFDFPRLLRQLDKHGGLESFLAAFFAAPKKTSDLVLAMNLVAMASCYSPAADEPPGFALPFEPRTGRIREEVWRRWLEQDPVRLVERHAAELQRLRLLFLDCGSRDQFHLQYGLRTFTERLRALGVPHVAEEFDDDHSDTSYRYDVSLPRLWESIRA